MSCSLQLLSIGNLNLLAYISRLDSLFGVIREQSNQIPASVHINITLIVKHHRAIGDKYSLTTRQSCTVNHAIILVRCVVNRLVNLSITSLRLHFKTLTSSLIFSLSLEVSIEFIFKVLITHNHLINSSLTNEVLNALLSI